MTIYYNGQDQTKAKAVVATKTTDYTITTSDFGKTLRMNSGSDKTFTLPSVSAVDDGARLTVVKLGAGKVTIQAADSDIIADSTAGGTIYNNTAAQIYADVNLEYVDATVTWVIRGAHGSWTTT
jgi:hypothetical protein